MGKIKKFKIEGLYLTGLLILVLVFLLGGVHQVTYPVIKNTQIFKSIHNIYEEKVWVTFTSQRAKFSFKHPLSWPVSAIDFNTKNGMYKYLAEDGIIEYVNFEEKFSNQAGGTSLGFILVSKSNYSDLKEYIEDLSKEQTVDMFIKGRTQKVTMKPPKVEFLKIGGLEAIKVIDINAFATLTNKTTDYHLIRNGKLYRFVMSDSSRFLQNKEKNYQTFQQILSSVQFFD